MASLLFESVKTTPWIESEQSAIDLPKDEVRTEFHQPSCAHKKDSAENRGHLLHDPTEFYRKRDAMQRSVAAVCGLAGVFPPSKRLHIECGHVSFAGDRASVHYEASVSDPADTRGTTNMVKCTLRMYCRKVLTGPNRGF